MSTMIGSHFGRNLTLQARIIFRHATEAFAVLLRCIVKNERFALVFASLAGPFDSRTIFLVALVTKSHALACFRIDG